MEEALRERLKMRHQQVLDLIAKAQNVLEGAEIQLADWTHMRLLFKLSITALEKETYKFIEQCGNSDTFLKTCMEDQMKAEDILCHMDSLSEITSQTNKDANQQVARLPKLDLMKYSGDILKFTDFWDQFEASVHSRNIKDVDKMAYLLGTLQGVALETVEGLGVTNANYKVAVDTLRERFGSKEKVIDAHYNALLKLDRCTNEASKCRQTINIIEKHLRVLQNLGEDTSSSHLRVLLSNKFPEAIMYQVHLLAPGDQSIQQLRKSLDNVIAAMERSGSEKIIAKVHQEELPSTSTASLHIDVVKQRGTKRGISSSRQKKWQIPFKKNKRQCIFCEGTHYSNECRRVSNLKDRKAKLQGRCFICFRRGHNAKTCRVKKTCFFCKGHHNSALCSSNSKKEKQEHKVTEGKQGHIGNNKVEETNTLNITEQVLNTNIRKKSFLQTAVVMIQHNKSKQIPCRLILDSGSQRSYITTRLASKLNINPDKDDFLTMYTFGSNSPKTIHSPSAEITLKTKRDICKEVRVNLVAHITDKIPVVNMKINDSVDFLADDDSEGEDVDLLIGNDYYFSFIRSERTEIEDLILVNTDFGWIMSGNAEHAEENILSVITYYCQCHDVNTSYFTEPDLPLRSIDMKFLWSLESIGITDSPKTTREEEAVKYFNDTVTYNNGRYEIKWLWIQYPPDLPTNYSLAYGRLKSMLRRLDESTLTEYQRILNEQLGANIIEEVEPGTAQIYQTNPPVHYLAHHIVMQKGKSGRIVYDASAKIKDRNSLNECMYRGPSLLEDLTVLLLNFRTKKIGITADVEKAFLQIGLQEEDRDVTRFLWIKDPTKELSEDNLSHFRFRRLPFGIICSPFLLTATIRYHMSKTNEPLLEKIADKCYVDNLVTSVESLEEASQLYDNTTAVFNELSMNFRDWISNDDDFMVKIPERQRGKEEGRIKILGLLWNLKEDTLQLKVEDKAFETRTKDYLTKKEVLRALARVYDPCGFVSPLVLPAKLLFQELCILKVKWDSPLPEELAQKWESVKAIFKNIKNVKIPRYVGKDLSEGTKHYELHVYTDASKSAYAAVAYLRILCGKQIKTAFLMSKCRVTPVEDKDNLKIPRLELLGFLIGSRLLKYLKRNMNLTVDKQYLWTDSQVVLHWLKTNNLLPPFVKRRVDEINQLKDVEFCYISSNENPADLGTRPELWEAKKSLWFSGPPFLKEESKFWPSNRYLDQKTLLSVGEALNIIDGPEMVMKGYEIDPPEYLTEEDHEMDTGRDLGITNIIEAETSNTEIVKNIQKKHFPDEVNGKKTHLTRNLDLFLDVDGILRCGGRMKNTNWSYDKKHPILIPKESEFTNKVIQEAHEKNYHVGPPHTLNIIREQYWIPQGKAQVTKVLKRCEKCMKQSGGPYKLPPTPALPSERVNYSAPYTFTGVDYFGPMYVNTTSGNKEKRWICLFTCLAVRAIHLEVVKDLTAEECLLAIRRFVAVRGTPAMIISDNALQFKLVSEILINAYCTENKVKWKFIPQLAPWHGGFYERLVGIVKHCLKRTLDKHLLNDSQLSTVIKEAESVVNTRPLTNVGADLDHILRPADFLTLGKCLEMTPSEKVTGTDGTTTKLDLIQGWKRGQTLLAEFKKMFQQQYLPSLREKHRCSVKQPRVTSDRTPQLGDLVQIKEDSKNRSLWKVGKIVSLLKGQDGQHRVATVKVGNSEFTRSIGHLYPLEIDSHNEETTVPELSSTDIPISLDTTHQVEQSAELIPVTIDIDPPQHTEGTSEQQSDTTVSIEQRSDTVDSVVQGQPSTDELDNDETIPIDLQPAGILPVSPADEGASGSRPERQAAIQARKKIAEWTRNLTVLLQ